MLQFLRRASVYHSRFVFSNGFAVSALHNTVHFFSEWFILVGMEDSTIITTSPVGQHLERVAGGTPVSYLMFNQKKISLVAKMTIGRNPDCSIVIDNKLVSRVHASIQKIRDAYFLKDESSTNGTFINGHRIPADKYVKLNRGDKITVGAFTLVMS